MAETEYTRNRPRLNTTIAESTLTALNDLTAALNLPHAGITIDFIVAERVRLHQALRAANIPIIEGQPA